MARIRDQIHKDQAEHARPVSELDGIIELAVCRAIEKLADRPLPVRGRYLRSETGSRYLGKHAEFLQEDRRDANRENRPPRFRFRKIGCSVLYDIVDLDAAVAALPTFGGIA